MNIAHSQKFGEALFPSSLQNGVASNATNTGLNFLIGFGLLSALGLIGYFAIKTHLASQQPKYVIIYPNA